MTNTELKDLIKKNHNELSNIVKDILVLTYFGNDKTKAYEFSMFPSYRNSENKGFTFGLTQFDVTVNWEAISCLKRCKFKPYHIMYIITGDKSKLRSLNKKISFFKNIIDEYDNKHIDASINRILSILEENKITIDSLATFVHLLNYHLLFFINNRGPLINWLSDTNNMIVTSDLVNKFFLINTKWGVMNPDLINNQSDIIHQLVEQKLNV